MGRWPTHTRPQVTGEKAAAILPGSTTSPAFQIAGNTSWVIVGSKNEQKPQFWVLVGAFLWRPTTSCPWNYSSETETSVLAVSCSRIFSLTSFRPNLQTSQKGMDQELKESYCAMSKGLLCQKVCLVVRLPGSPEAAYQMKACKKKVFICFYQLRDAQNLLCPISLAEPKRPKRLSQVPRRSSKFSVVKLRTSQRDAWRLDFFESCLSCSQSARSKQQSKKKIMCQTNQTTNRT